MFVRKCFHLATILFMLGLPMLAAGCGDSKRDVGEPGGKANAATERGAGPTTASPGGPNVTPNEGTPPVGR
ncbi:MAG: hypothetical protein ACLQGP_38335 [Isosphaeraceae bacterium]